MATSTGSVSYEMTGTHRLFYTVGGVEGEPEPSPESVSANCYTAGSGNSVVSFKELEPGIWDLSFDFEIPGKYLFSIHEDGVKKFILIVIIMRE